MDDKTYSVLLSDGTRLSGLRMNGNTFVADDPIDPTIFDGNCSGVVIDDGEVSEVHPFMEYVPTAQPVPGEFWFVLRDVSEQEMAMMQMQANIEYIGMMAGVEI